MPSIDLQSPFLPQPKTKGSEQVIVMDDYISAPTSLIPFGDLLDFSEFSRFQWIDSNRSYVDDLDLNPSSPTYSKDINWLDAWKTTEGHSMSAAQKVRFVEVKNQSGQAVTIDDGSTDESLPAFNISSSGELRFKSRMGDSLTIKTSFFLENEIDSGTSVSSSRGFKRSIQVNAKYVGDTSTLLDNVDYRLSANTYGWTMNDESSSWEKTSFSGSFKSSVGSGSATGILSKSSDGASNQSELRFSSYKYNELDAGNVSFSISFRGKINKDEADDQRLISVDLNKILVTTTDYRLSTNILRLKYLEDNFDTEFLPVDNWNQVSTSYHTSFSELIFYGNNVVTITNPEGISIDVRDGNDRVVGGAGDDIIRGGRGKDVLTGGVTAGGGNADIFVYGSEISEGVAVSSGTTVKMNAFNRDTITDFTSGTDKIAFVYDELELDLDPMLPIEITTAIFGSNATGKNATGTSATSFNFIYNTSDKTLYYDADGGEDGLEIAVVTLGVASLNATDLIFI